jgi:hypothetical protein
VKSTARFEPMMLPASKHSIFSHNSADLLINHSSQGKYPPNLLTLEDDLNASVDVKKLLQKQSGV